MTFLSGYDNQIVYYILPAVIMSFIAYTPYFLTVYKHIKFSMKAIKHFDSKLKNITINYEKWLPNEFKNNGLLPINYMHIYSFLMIYNKIDIKTIRKVFKENTYYILAFFIYNMHLSKQTEHQSYYIGMYYNYINYFNK
ncbi:hypothetical protein [Mycoplasma sp. 4423]